MNQNGENLTECQGFTAKTTDSFVEFEALPLREYLIQLAILREFGTDDPSVVEIATCETIFAVSGDKVEVETLFLRPLTPVHNSSFLTDQRYDF